MPGVEVCYLRFVCALPLGIPHATQQDAQLCVCLSVRLSVPCSRSKSAIYGIPHSCICPSVRLSVCPSVRPSVCLSMRPDATITVAACRRVPSAAGDPSRDPAGRPAVRMSVACSGSKSAIYDCCAQCRWASRTRPSRTRSCVATRSRATRSSSPTTRRSI